MADFCLLTMVAHPSLQKTPGTPNLIASPGGISAANESPSRPPGSGWLWLGKKINQSSEPLGKGLAWSGA